MEEDDTGTNGRDKPRRGRPAYRRAACQIVVVVVVVVVVAGRQWSLIHNIPNQYVFDHGVRRKQSESLLLLSTCWLIQKSFSNSFLVVNLNYQRSLFINY